MRGKVSYHIVIMLILGISVSGCHGSGAPDGYRHPAELCHEAEVLLSEQRVSEAMIAADEAMTAPDADDIVKGRSCLILSLCHTMAGNSASALTFAEMALAHIPEDEDTQTIYADALIDARRYSECVAYIESVPDAGKALRRRRIPALIGLGPVAEGGGPDRQHRYIPAQRHRAGAEGLRARSIRAPVVDRP